MRTAKIYENCPRTGEPYQLFGDWYVDVNTPNGPDSVRLYTDQEYNLMYPPNELSPKLTLGFDAGYITLIYGDDLESVISWLKDTGARFHKIFRWYYPSTVETPQVAPMGVHFKQLNWDDISIGNYLKSDYELQEILDGIFYGKTKGEYVGEVGDRITKVLTVRNIVELETRYGKAVLYVFTDPDENVYEWLTHEHGLKYGDTNVITGTIKSHDCIRGEKRTKITRCNLMKYNGNKNEKEILN